MVESQPPNNPESGLSSFQGTFVGRHQEMGELKAALDDALSGQGRLVMLAGEPGIGKTRTAQELASHAETLEAQILWGRCYEEEGTPPTGPGCSFFVPTFNSKCRNNYQPRWVPVPLTSPRLFLN